MTDLEFYQHALGCQSWLVNRISESWAYRNYWSNDFSLRDIRNAIETYYADEYVKSIFNLDNLTKERAKFLRFLRWSNDNENFYCFPLWFALFLPYGTEVTRISGDKFKYAEDTDLDIRLGCVAFGVNLKD